MPSTTLTLSGQDFSTGESVIIGTQIPLRGWSALSSIVTNVVGNTSDRVLNIQFRFSYDAIHFTDWADVATEFNPLNIGIKDDAMIDFKIDRKGSDKSGIVTLTSIVLHGNYEQSYFDLFNFLHGTVFEEIAYDDINFNILWINLLRKLYKRNIVPSYIIRGEDDDTIDDTDYIVYWKVVAYFFALIGELSRRKIEGLTEDSDYLTEYLTQKGLFFCDECDDCLSELIYILHNIFDEFRQRGTANVALPAREDKISTGEMLRMICWKETDEMLFEYLPRHLSGWTMNRTSPMYKGKTGHTQLNLAPEYTSDILDLTKYTTVNLNPSLSLFTDDGKKVVKLIPTSSIAFSAYVDPTISHEITFLVKFSAANVKLLSLQVDAFADNVATSVSGVTGTPTNVILNQVSMPNNNVYYSVRCIIYQKNTTITGNDAKTSLLQGENLRHDSYNTNKIIVTISCDGSFGAYLYIWNIKLTPLGFDKSSVYLNAYNVMNVYLNNRNTSLTIIDFEERMRRYLVPYGTVFQAFYSSQSQFSPDTYLLQNSGDRLLQNDGNKFKI